MTTTDLQEMTTPDKLRLMEALWQDLSRADSEVDSPEWHRQVLAERDRLTDSGKEAFIDWDTAKKQLREELQ
jgi:hypothetical protein